MAKYQKKPVIVEAEVYEEGLEDGFDFFTLGGQFLCSLSKEAMKNGYPRSMRKPYLNTLEGKMYISDGDYIITGVRGERYACRPDIFEETYIKISDEAEED